MSVTRRNVIDYIEGLGFKKTAHESTAHRFELYTKTKTNLNNQTYTIKWWVNWNGVVRSGRYPNIGKSITLMIHARVVHNFRIKMIEERKNHNV